jgi:hypothetical protein
MPEVDLFTRDGEFVAKVPFLPYKTPPDGICWGQRFFLRREDGKYYEGFIHFVPPTQT